MKTIGYFLLVLITVLNCKQKELTPDEILDLKVNQTFPIKIETRSTKIQLLSINESRCIGRNIVCIWGGLISIKLAVTNADKTPIELSIVQGGSMRGPESIPYSDTQIKIDNVPYVISFEKVDVKNPNEDNIAATPRENYTIWLKLTKM